MDHLNGLPVDSYEWSVRTRNTLMLNGINTMEQVLNLTKAEAMRLPNFGERTWQEVADVQSYAQLRSGEEFEDELRATAARLNDLCSGHPGYCLDITGGVLRVLKVL